MKCGVCKKELINSIKVRGGYICQNCFEACPAGVKENVSKFTAKQIADMKQLYRKESSRFFLRYDEFKLTDTSVILNGFEYSLGKLRSVRLNFHPRAMGQKPNVALGDITIVLDTRAPHVMIEEPISEYPSEIFYNIWGVNITYVYPQTLATMVNKVQESIDSKAYHLKQFHVECDAWYKAKKKKEQEGAKKAEQNRKTNQGSSRNEPVSDFDRALHMFGLSMPFTKTQLSRTWHRILQDKKLHPDNGGSTTEFQKYNEAYDLLRKFATK